jgi:hypothetical protein
MKELNQNEFSKYILNRLLQRFPQFNNYYKLENDIMTIEYPSKTGLLILWITTQDNEITIGFDNIEGDCEWHTHMSQYNAYEPEDELREAINLINNILIGNEIIVFNNNLGVFITDNPEETIKNKLEGEILELKKWYEI